MEERKTEIAVEGESRVKRTGRTAQKKEKFLDILADVGNVRQAVQLAGVGRTTVYEWRAADVEFAEAWEAALDASADVLEQEAWRRAVEGTEEPVHYQGQRVDLVRRYSDTLLIFLLKGFRPDKYQERQRVQQEVSLSIKLPDLDED